MELNPVIKQHFARAAQHIQARQWTQAEAIYSELLIQFPDVPEVHYNLATALKSQGRLEEAVVEFRKALALSPNFPQALNNLGNTLRELERPWEAIDCFRQAVTLRSDYALAWNNLSGVLKATGQLDQSLAALDRAIALAPNHVQTQDNRLYGLGFHPRFDDLAIFNQACDWNDRFALPHSLGIQPHRNDPSPQRRLRIGYVSGDFRRHCQALFTSPLLANHDHEQFEIFCYSSVRTPDAVTARLRSHADAWREVTDLTDPQVAQLVRDDQIDILVDLTLHMTGNRLLIFAHKPAPVQVTWLGYPGTTGMEAMDYRLSDPQLDPVGTEARNPKSEIRINDQNPNDPIPNGVPNQRESLRHLNIGKLGFDSDFGFRISDFATQEPYYSEQTVRLPDSFWCYDPYGMEDSPYPPLPEPAPLPALETGYVTFGCLNNFCKINDPLLDLWAQALAAAPEAHLLLLAPVGPHRQHVVERLKVDPRRVEFVPFQPRRQYLETYRRIDLCLDTLPANGHTTSLDALWMGVPVITRVGHTALGRGGASQLYNMGLRELVAHSDAQFVQLAAELAGDLDRLIFLRSGVSGAGGVSGVSGGAGGAGGSGGLTLRRRMELSPLMDGPRFAGHIQNAFRLMWRTWCQTRSSS